MKDTKYQIALLKACRIVGGQKQLAEKIKIGPSRLNKWINRNKGTVPYQYALDIEDATLGQVTCYELIPKWDKVVEHCKRKKRPISKFYDDQCVTNDHLQSRNDDNPAEN